MDKRRRRPHLLFLLAALFIGTIFGTFLITNAARVTFDINGTSFDLNDSGVLWINGTANITGLAYYNGSLICTADNGLCGAVGPSGEPLWQGNSTLVCYADGTNCITPATPYQSAAAGWSNTSTVTSTTKNISISDDLSITWPGGGYIIGHANGTMCLYSGANSTGSRSSICITQPS